MREEKSCGAVVFTRQQGKIEYLLIRNLSGMYGFPKGHMEPGETELETARREIFEETGLEVEFLPGFRAEDTYRIPAPQITKQVVLFLASFSGQTYRFQEKEISGGGLYSFAEARKLLQFAGSRRILREANDFLMAK